MHARTLCLIGEFSVYPNNPITFEIPSMLQELSIRNFAIIDDLRISFSGGFSILSGETGAGKSIIINAVNLLLGSRATAKMIRSGAETAELEALFQIAPGSRVADVMDGHGFDAADGLLIRRIISRQNRHRNYINGRLATVQVLNAITENIASISGQHAHQGLLNEDQQLDILDQIGNLILFRREVYRCYHEMKPLIEQRDELIHIRDRQTEHTKLLEFQKKEIGDAAVTSGEDATLEQERIRLKNAETLYAAVHGSIEELYSADGAVTERLIEVRKNLEKASRIDPELSSGVEQMAEAAFLLEGIAEELRHYLQKIRIDENRLDTVEARLDILSRLKRKYGKTLDDVISHFESIDHELSDIENISEKIAEIEKRISELHDKLVEAALKLSEKRKKAAEALSKKVEKELSTLEMSQTEFQVSLQTTPADDTTDSHLSVQGNTVDETGIDQSIFLIAPNVGEPLKPLSHIVSGGELSRVVLALKAILAESESVETIVFDEVDAGIGGKVAEVVGKKLSALSRHHQIICITHLPQIAKFGDHHYRISKRVSGGRTKTTIRSLNEPERIKEIARMLGGVKITRATLEHAQELLEK